ncbi:RICIN domain-containing protein [Chitinophaga sp. Hz27]|uniref:RICIN domain-containing protein n=1 Tax=Chitinophaga sp. Hz27 TaxID=3347169 RepID=UPI0035D8705B
MKTITIITLLNIIWSSSCFSQTIKGTYAIANVETGIYLRIKDADTQNGTSIVAYSPVNWKCVTWDFKQVDNNAYQLTNLYSGKTFQPANLTPVAGSQLEEQPVNANQETQQYEFLSAGNAQYLIRLKGTDLYITPADNKGRINAPVKLANKIPGNLQHWTLKAQHPDM